MDFNHGSDDTVMSGRLCKTPPLKLAAMIGFLIFFTSTGCNGSAPTITDVFATKLAELHDIGTHHSDITTSLLFKDFYNLVVSLINQISGDDNWCMTGCSSRSLPDTGQCRITEAPVSWSDTWSPHWDPGPGKHGYTGYITGPHEVTTNAPWPHGGLHWDPGPSSYSFTGSGSDEMSMADRNVPLMLRLECSTGDDMYGDEMFHQVSLSPVPLVICLSLSY